MLGRPEAQTMVLSKDVCKVVTLWGCMCQRNTFKNSSGFQSQTHPEMVNPDEGNLCVENCTSLRCVQIITANRTVFLQNALSLNVWAEEE